ncbi:MAG: ATP-binding cassette domain-containing protein [Filimonas sp.]|nr:ATP-binding cassette domain-containing protein [Filimonas sp.]
MQVSLSQVIPIPLKDKIVQRNSDVWNKELSFNSTEWIKIKAPSGTGKTTLVHILYKLREDYSGAVLYDQEQLSVISAEKLAQLRQANISIIFQDLRLFPNLTARENIELKRVLHKPVYEEKVIDEMAERLQVSHILKQRAGLCSYGEQQRIAIIRALIQPFEWLVMDEPFSHLDQANIAKASALIAEECSKRNAGFLLTDLDADEHFNYSKQLNL